jgi:transcriptional regulator with XRE-family HTH domain
MAERDPAVIGARIARRRHQLDMTQVELAEALGVSPSTVANWERGVSYPARKIGKIEQLLGRLSEADPAASDDDALARIEAQAAEMLATARRMRAERELGGGTRNRHDETESRRHAG